MSGRPDWQEFSLRDACVFTQKPKNLKLEGVPQIPFVPMDLIPEGFLYSKRFVLKPSNAITSGTYFEEGDILLPKITPSFENGKQAILEGLPTPFGLATTEVIPIKGKPGLSDKVWLFYYLLQPDVRADLAGKMEGTTGRQRLSKSTLERLNINLPPIEEQRAIARVLEAIQRARQARQRELALERERKAAVMERLFTYGTRGEPTKQTEIGEIPRSWQVTKLGDTCEFLQYGTSQRCDAIDGGVPVLGIPNVVGRRVSPNGLRFLRATDEERTKLELKTGDLVFVRTNANREFTGRCAVFRGEVPNALFASYLIRARLTPQSLLSDFVREYTDTWRGKSFLSGRASHAADGKFNINTQTIRGVLVPKPSLEEQAEIAVALRACDAKIDLLERETFLLAELFKVVLEELMTGRLSAMPLIEEHQTQ